MDQYPQVFHSLFFWLVNSFFKNHGSIVCSFSSTVKEAHLTSSKYSGKSKRDKYAESDSDDDELDRPNEAT